MQVSCVLADDEVMLTIKPGQVRFCLSLMYPARISQQLESSRELSLLFKDFSSQRIPMSIFFTGIKPTVLLCMFPTRICKVAGGGLKY